MRSQIDLQTLLGLFSATGLPLLFNAALKFLHPSLYTLTCGVAWSDASPKNCYAVDRLEAVLFLCFSAVAVGYGIFRFWLFLRNNPTPTNTITVRGTDGQETTIATMNPPGETAAPTPATKGTP